MNITQSPYTSNITKSQGTKTERVKSGSPKSDTIQDKAAVKISGSFKAKNTSRLPDQVFRRIQRMAQVDAEDGNYKEIDFQAFCSEYKKETVSPNRSQLMKLLEPLTMLDAGKSEDIYKSGQKSKSYMEMALEAMLPPKKRPKPNTETKVDPFRSVMNALYPGMDIAYLDPIGPFALKENERLFQMGDYTIRFSVGSAPGANLDIYNQNGKKVLSYNPLEMKWSSYPTEAENKMQREIESVYDDAYYTARAEIESRKAAEDSEAAAEPGFNVKV